MISLPPISFSALDTYDQCPFRYYKLYVKREREPASKYLLYGSAFHELLDYIYEEGSFSSLLAFQSWPSILSKEMMKKQYSKITQDEMVEVENNGLRDLNNFFSLARRENLLRPAIQHELAITGSYKKHPLKAKIDLITNIRGGVGILDWKTGNPDKKVLMQLALYAALYSKQTGKMVDWICPVYIKTDEMVYQPFDSDIRKEAGQFFSTIYERFINDKQYLPTKNKYCSSCSFKKECKSKGI